MDLPSGTVTFLFTDFESSASFWERDPAAMQTTLERHNDILHGAVKSHGGVIFKIVGDSFQAESLLDDGQALRRRIGHNWGIAITLGSLACVTMRQGDFRRTRRVLAESLALRKEIGDIGGVACHLERHAEMAGMEGEFNHQAVIFGAAAAWRESIPSVIDPADQPHHKEQLETAMK